MMKHPFMFSALIFIAGCSKNGSSSNCSKKINSRLIKKKSLVSEQEAKLSDLAVPLDASVLKSFSMEDSYAYHSSISVPDLAQFIEEEMESLGWKLMTKFVDKEASLVFEKPFKYSTVSIRPHSGKTLVIFFSSNK